MNNAIYILLFLGSVLLASFSQILLKKSAGRQYASFLREYLNPGVIIAYGLFFGTTLINVIAYAHLPLSLGPVLESAGYVYIAVLSYLFLREKLTLRKILGMAVIILGILVYSL